MTKNSVVNDMVPGATQLLPNLSPLGPGYWSEPFIPQPAPELAERVQLQEGQSAPTCI